MNKGAEVMSVQQAGAVRHNNKCLPTGVQGLPTVTEAIVR
jgi:hypothetical protein